MDDELQQPDAQLFDMSQVQPIEHCFEKIVGNRLTCTIHDNAQCPVILIKPTEVLERNEQGELVLVDKARVIA